VGEDQSQTGRRHFTVAEASEVLGITVEAVRGRIKRDKLEHDKDGGTVYVYLDADQPKTGHQPDEDQARPDALADELRDRIRYLERQVEEEREARRRADTILAQLSAANAEQARTIRALEAPQEASEDAETVEEATDELGAERTRRETAETTLHEGMAEERRRREEAERERDELRRELYARREPRGSPETVEEKPEGVEPTSYAVEVHESTQEATEAPEATEEQQGRGRPHPDGPGARAATVVA
jgi:hypothetical protein